MQSAEEEIWIPAEGCLDRSATKDFAYDLLKLRNHVKMRVISETNSYVQ